MNSEDVSRKIAEVINERDPVVFDAKVNAIVDEIVEQHPDGPDFYTVKEQVMGSIRRMLDILEEGDE